VIALDGSALVHVSDQSPGYSRRRCGKGFTYLNTRGNTIRDRPTRKRIQSLVIPPAWEQVWICPAPNGHLQATGRDTKKRKVYRYHDAYRDVRDAMKFQRLAVFGAALPAIRRQIETDLRKRSLCRERVIAIALELMQTGLLRVGNEAYTRDNNTFGLTTLHNRHIDLSTRRIRLSYTGKSGKARDITVEDRSLARAARQLSELPGQRLFQYLDDDDKPQPIDSGDINRYLSNITGLDLSAKDFRTWSGTVLAAEALSQSGPAKDQKKSERNIVEAVKQTAADLGNTPAVCRKYYIHPLILERYEAGMLCKALDQAKNPLGRVDRRLLKKREAQVLSLLLGV
jgi:DNA topoisomerase-1